MYVNRNISCPRRSSPISSFHFSRQAASAGGYRDFLNAFSQRFPRREFFYFKLSWRRARNLGQSLNNRILCAMPRDTVEVPGLPRLRKVFAPDNRWYTRDYRKTPALYTYRTKSGCSGSIELYIARPSLIWRDRTPARPRADRNYLGHVRIQIPAPRPAVETMDARQATRIVE